MKSENVPVPVPCLFKWICGPAAKSPAQAHHNSHMGTPSE